MYRQGDHQRWIALIKEALRLARELGNRKDIAACLNALGHSAQMQDDYGRAATCYEESLHLAEELGNKIMVAVGLLNLGFLSLHLGQIDRATLRLRESLLLSQEENDILWIAVCLAGLAGVSGTRGRAERAAQLSGAIGMVFGRIAAQSNHILRAELEPLHQAEYERAIMLARAQLGEAAWAAAYAQGRALPLEQAIAYALSEGD
jgi:tetratricopeptide (TPR) repeat protein